jgi:hypothetical protein
MVGARIRDTSASTNSRIDDAANDVVDAMLQRIGLPVMQGFIRTEEGRSLYSLQPEVGQIKDNMFAKEDQQVVYPVQSNEFDTAIVKPTATGAPAFYRELNSPVGVTRQPESLLRLVSDDASDTRDVAVYGISGGRQKSETVTLTGTTAVLTSNKYTELTDLPTTTAHATATITATSNSTSAQTSYPTVANAGNLVVFTIVATATTSANLNNPGAHVRLFMGQDVDSGNPAGDQGQSVVIEGYVVREAFDFEKRFRREVLATDGTNPQSTGAVSVQLFTEITNISKSWTSTNTLLVRSDPEGVFIAQIPPEQRSVEYPQVQLYPEPSGGKSVWFNYYPKWVRLINDGDVPYFDSRFDNTWVKWTERVSRAFKRNEGYAISIDPEFQLDVGNIIDNQGMRDNPKIAMGSGLKEPRRNLTLGRLDPSRYSNRR